MKNRNKKIFKPMTRDQLQRNDRFFLLVVIIAFFFIFRSFYLSANDDIPQIGWIGYITGPMFTHKFSEILLLLMWLPVAWLFNYENAGLWPEKMSASRYYRLLQTLLIIAPFQIILAVYAWTIVNLGASPLTTDYRPLILGEDWWVWRYYLGAVILAGALFIPIAARKIIYLTVQLNDQMTKRLND